VKLGGPVIKIGLRIFALVAALAAALATVPLIAQQQDFSKVEIKADKLAPSIYMLTGAGGNMGLSVGDDSAILVDDQYAPLTPKIVDAVAKLSATPVGFVINTHWHGDHTGGNDNLGKAGVVIVAHENVRKRMSSEQFIAFMNMKVNPDPRIALPVVTFASDVTFHLNGEEIVVRHVPRAHTDGDAIVHFRNADVVHMGDIFFNKMYPFIDASTGGTLDGTIAGADRGLELAGTNTKIIPGHGPLATKADLQAYRDMLATVAARIKDAKRAGKTMEETIAAKPTAEFDPVFGKGFLPADKWVEMLWKGPA